MKILIQRVSHAQVHVDGQLVGAIDQGLLVLLGIGEGDGKAEANKLIAKLLQLRVFSDEAKKMNRNIQDMNGGILVISQFTLMAETKKGTRPSFSKAAPADQARALYDYFVDELKKRHTEIATGRFGADMDVQLCNQGPVTLMLEA